MAENVTLNNLSDYKVPDNLSDKYHNIMTFAKNMVLKDSKYFEEREDSISAEMGRILMKYFDSELSDQDISSLMTNVYEYNMEVEKILNLVKYDTNDNLVFKDSTTSEEKIEYNNFVKSVVFGLGSDDNFNSTFKLKKAYKSSFIRMLTISINNSQPDDSQNSEDIISSMLLSHLNTHVPTTNDSDGNTVDDPNNINYRPLTLTDYSNSDITGIFIQNNRSAIKAIEESLKNRFLIRFKTGSTTNQYEKRSASNTERSCVEAGEQVVILDIKSKDFTFTGDTGKSETIKSYFSSSAANSKIRTNSAINFQLVYKEFNPRYRALLESDIIEFAVDMLWDSTISTSMSDKKNSVTKSTLSAVREIADNIFIKDIKDSTNKVTETTKLFKYRYSNPYTARRAAESDLIQYYIGDDYISGGYGKYSYQRSEIYSFIEIFKETREYFYSVLLNEAFINEESYPVYEKMYIIFLAVMRFMTATVDNVRSIEMFSRADILNFLASFGLADLSFILNETDFINSESYAKEMVKRYVDLVQNKGSRAVIDVLEEIFSLKTTKLTIYKNFLIGDVRNTKDYDSDSSTDDPKYKFIKVDYNNRNILETITSGIDSATDLAVTVRGDKSQYWDPNDTTDAELNRLGVNTANTKYIIPEVQNEFSEAFFSTRLLFELIDYIGSKITNTNDDDTTNISFNIHGFFEGRLDEYVKLMRYLWIVYMQLSVGLENIEKIGSYTPITEHIFYKTDSDGNLTNEEDYRVTQYPQYLHIKENVHMYTFDREQKVRHTIITGYNDNGSPIVESYNTYTVNNLLNLSAELNDVTITDGKLDLSSMFNYEKESGSDIVKNITLKQSVSDLIFAGNKVEPNVKSRVETYLVSMAYIYYLSKYHSSFKETENYNFTNGLKYISGGASLTDAVNIIAQWMTGDGLIRAFQNGDIYNYQLPAPIYNLLIDLYRHTYFDVYKSNSTGPRDSLMENSILNPATGSKPGKYSEYITDFQTVVTNNSNLSSNLSKICEDLNDKSTVRNSIIRMCNEYMGIYENVLMNLNLSAKDDSMIQFLESAINFFISYTTEIYDFVYKNTYNSFEECSDPTDAWTSSFTMTDIDSFYYDESVEFILSETKGGTSE